MRKIVALLAVLVLLAAPFVPTASAQVGYPFGYGYGPGFGYPVAPLGYPGWSYGIPSFGYGIPWYSYGVPGFGMGWVGYGVPGYAAPSTPTPDTSSGSSGRVCIMIYPPPPGC